MVQYEMRVSRDDGHRLRGCYSTPGISRKTTRPCCKAIKIPSQRGCAVVTLRLQINGLMLVLGLYESDDPKRGGRNFLCLLVFGTHVGVCPSVQIYPVAAVIGPAVWHGVRQAFQFAVIRSVVMTAHRTDNIELPDVPWRFGGDSAANCHHAGQPDNRDCPRSPRLRAFCARLYSLEAVRLALQRRNDFASFSSSC